MHIRACHDQGFPTRSNGVHPVSSALVIAQNFVCLQYAFCYYRSVQPESVAFVRAFCSDETTPRQKMDALKTACKRHVDLTRECSKGLGQDRLLYALAAVAKDPTLGKEDPEDMSPVNADAKVNGGSDSEEEDTSPPLPAIFRDPGYSTINHSVLSTSNCGNPCLRMFGFGAVVPDGFGIGYIIKVSSLLPSRAL